MKRIVTLVALSIAASSALAQASAEENQALRFNAVAPAAQIPAQVQRSGNESEPYSFLTRFSPV